MWTKAMARAERWLIKQGGSGVIDKRGVLLAGGEFSPFAKATWLRLVAEGRIIGKNGRLEIAGDLTPPLSAQIAAEASSGT